MIWQWNSAGLVLFNLLCYPVEVQSKVMKIVKFVASCMFHLGVVFLMVETISTNNVIFDYCS